MGHGVVYNPRIATRKETMMPLSQRVLVWANIAALLWCLDWIGGSETWADVSRWTHLTNECPNARMPE